MAKRGFHAIDSDMHVIEPPDLWERYIAPEFKHLAPLGMQQWRRDIRVQVKTRIISRAWPRRGPSAPANVGSNLGWKKEQDELYAEGEDRGWDPTSQVSAMDKEGLDKAVLFPSRGLFVLGLDTRAAMGDEGLEPPYAAAIAHAYNSWLHDFCKEKPDRLYGAGMVAPHDVESAVTEARRCVKDLGFKAIFLLPGTVNRRPWHDPVYEPLWAECEALDVAVGFHGGGRNYLTPDFALNFESLTMYHTFTHPVGLMTAVVSFAGGGILHRHPDLRVAFLEGNCSWAPWLLHRLDGHHEWVGGAEFPELTMKPSEYFARGCYLSVEADEEPARYFIDRFGDDQHPCPGGVTGSHPSCSDADADARAYLYAGAYANPGAYLYARAYADPVTHGYPASERLLPGMGGTGAGVGTGWERIRTVEPSTRH